MAELITVEDVMPIIGDKAQLLRRVNTGSGRHYYTVTDAGITFYASWTTVIKRILGTSEYLVKWIADKGYEESRAYMQERAHYGTIMHIIIGKFLEKGSYRIDAVHSEASMYLFNNKLDVSLAEAWAPELKSDLLAFAQWVADKDVEVIACELPLTYERDRIAGTIDLVCNLTFNKRRVRAIVDFKSGRKGFFAEHKYQLHGYRMMWNENFPETPIDMVFNWSPKDWTKAPSYNFENQTDEPERFALLGLLTQHGALFPDSAPKPVRHFTGEVKVGQPTSENYAFVEVEAFLKERHGIQTEQAD
jgi:hypothetical protein